MRRRITDADRINIRRDECERAGLPKHVVDDLCRELTTPSTFNREFRQATGDHNIRIQEQARQKDYINSLKMQVLQAEKNGSDKALETAHRTINVLSEQGDKFEQFEDKIIRIIDAKLLK